METTILMILPVSMYLFPHLNHECNFQQNWESLCLYYINKELKPTQFWIHCMFLFLLYLYIPPFNTDSFFLHFHIPPLSRSFHNFEYTICSLLCFRFCSKVASHLFLHVSPEKNSKKPQLWWNLKWWLLLLSPTALRWLYFFFSFFSLLFL